MIDFTRAFSTAWERMTIILFRPLDFGKWFTLGFVAFLAMLAEGGASINFPPYLTGGDPTYRGFADFLHQTKAIPTQIGHYLTSPWILVYALAGTLTLVVWLVLSWVGSRGQFVFLDNIVRNRASIAIPWKHYARQGNIWFLIRIGTVLVESILNTAILIALAAANWTWINAERFPKGGEITFLIVTGAVALVLYLATAIPLFFLYAMIQPLHFKQKLSLGASVAAVAKLGLTRPLDITLYLLVSVLLYLALCIVVLFLIGIICCCVFCFAYVPFIGSLVIGATLCQLMLPTIVFARCFQLDVLAQFGPEFDVWTVDVPAASTGLIPPFTPLRPLE